MVEIEIVVWGGLRERGKGEGESYESLTNF